MQGGHILMTILVAILEVLTKAVGHITWL